MHCFEEQESTRLACVVLRLCERLISCSCSFSISSHASLLSRWGLCYVRPCCDVCHQVRYACRHRCCFPDTESSVKAASRPASWITVACWWHCPTTFVWVSSTLRNTTVRCQMFTSTVERELCLFRRNYHEETMWPKWLIECCKICIDIVHVMRWTTHLFFWF